MKPMNEADFAKKRDEVLQAMIAFDAGDAKRIQHFLKVYTYAALLGRQEGLPSAVQQTLELAAILHDIGIHAAEAKYGSPCRHLSGEGRPRARTRAARKSLWHP